MQKKLHLSRPIQMLANGLMIFCLQACATPSAPVQEVRILKPPSHLLTVCEKPNPEKMETNRDLVMYVYDLEFGFDLCAAKVDALRAFFDEVK